MQFNGVFWSQIMKKIVKKTLISTLVGAALLSSSVSAETVPGTDFNVHFEASNIVGAGRSINIHRVPVVIDSTGEIQFFDASFKLSLDSNKNLIFDSFTQITSPSFNSVDNFVAGTYKDTVGNKYTLSGPSVVGDGRTGWALSAIDEGGSFSISWITGAAIGHPTIGSREIANELASGFAYGIQGANNSGGGSLQNNWREGLLIGAQQVGDALVLSRFHETNSIDISSPTASINLNRVIQ
jgi:hypothetical protein